MFDITCIYTVCFKLIYKLRRAMVACLSLHENVMEGTVNINMHLKQIQQSFLKLQEKYVKSCNSIEVDVLT